MFSLLKFKTLSSLKFICILLQGQVLNTWKFLESFLPIIWNVLCTVYNSIEHCTETVLYKFEVLIFSKCSVLLFLVLKENIA
jgi:hypothetical protein